MATRTISVAGGNWDAVGTWDEGIVPVDGDAVVARGGGDSGNVTVNVASACTSIIMTNWVGTLTFNANLTTKGTTTFVAGVTVAGTVGYLILGATSTFTSAGKTMPNLQIGIGTTMTLTFADNARVSGTTKLGPSSNNTITLTSNTLRVDGDFTEQHGTSNAGGTTTIQFGGTGTWSNNSTGILSNPLTINTSGTLTISGGLRYNTGTITYTAGTVVTTGSTLTIIAGDATLNTAGVTWNNITLASAATYTINSLLSGSGTLTFGNANMTFAGTAGWTFADVRNTAYTATAAITLKNGVTYTVTNSLVNNGTTSAIKQQWKSASAGNKAFLTVSPGASVGLLYADPTDIDSSAGQKVYSFAGTLATTLGWTTVSPSSGFMAL